MSDFHKPVMLSESITGLKIKKTGIYIDATFGGGGHSKEILKNLSQKGKLIVFDQDDEAILKSKIIDDRMTIMNKNFRYLHNCLRAIGIEKIDGIIADLGVSSHQNIGILIPPQPPQRQHSLAHHPCKQVHQLHQLEVMGHLPPLAEASSSPGLLSF